MAFKGMRFCKECDNMLQAKEQKDDSGNPQLVYDCRICQNYEVAKLGDEADNCVYKSEQSKLSEKFLIVDKECIKDPTLSRRKNLDCKKCGYNEAVTFTNPTKDRMSLIFVCLKCSHSWMKESLDPKNDVPDPKPNEDP